MPFESLFLETDSSNTGQVGDILIGFGMFSFYTDYTILDELSYVHLCTDSYTT